MLTLHTTLKVLAAPAVVWLLAGMSSAPATAQHVQIPTTPPGPAYWLGLKTCSVGQVITAITVTGAVCSDLPSHAARHQHAGSDEVGVAVPGANAIPKAGAGATLAAGWIPDLSATYATAGSLNGHIVRTDNPHGVTGEQLGASVVPGAYAIAKAAGGGTLAAGWIPDLSGTYATQGNLTAHTGRTDNPHSVSAAQVGAASAQWNASQLQGRAIAAAAPADGQLMRWNAAASQWEPATVRHAVAFSAQTEISVPGETHGLGTADLTITCYDDAATPHVVEGDGWSIDPATFDVTIRFSTPQSGRCVLR
jgi:hypothetical protein